MKNKLLLVSVSFFAAQMSWAAPCVFKIDEEIRFFPTAAAQASSGTWNAKFHAWIFEPEKDSKVRDSLLSGLGKTLELTDEQIAEPLFQARGQLFLVDNERGKVIPLQFLGQPITLPKSGDHGQAEFDKTVTISSTTAVPGSWVTYETPACDGDKRTFTGQMQLIPAEGFSVIADIDDTLRISNATDRKLVIESTFLKPFEVVAGMPELFKSWEEFGTVFHYVSGSPWQLYPELQPFFDQVGYPKGTFSLRSFRWKDSTFWNLFKSPESYKPGLIEPLLKRFPKRKFILIGDSGEKDPEVYSALARKYPSQIVRIYIHQHGEEVETARYEKVFKDLPPALWKIYQFSFQLNADSSRIFSPAEDVQEIVPVESTPATDSQPIPPHNDNQ